MEENKWLNEGGKTGITPRVKKIADSINGDDIKLVENISKYVYSLSSQKWPHWRELSDHIESSADDLLKRNILYGCIEIGTVFRTLCISRKIPAIFVHTLSKKFVDFPPTEAMVNFIPEFKKKFRKLINEDFFGNRELIHKKWLEFTKQKINQDNLMLLLGLIESHVFVDVFVNDKWHTVDSSSLDWLHKQGDYSIKNWGKCEVMGKGLDDNDLGFTNMKTFREWIAKKYEKRYLLL